MQPTRRSCKTQEAAQVTLQRQTPASCCTSHAAASDAGLVPCTSQPQCEGPRANASHRLPTPRCAKIESASSEIFRATVQPRSRSVAPAAAASVLENGISTATCTHASMRFVRERRHPHMPQQKARQHAPRARWRLRGRARAAPAEPRGPTAKLTSGHPRHAGGAHLVPRGRAASGAGALCPPSGSRRGRASRRPLGCRWRRRRASAGRRCKAEPGTVRNLWQPLRAAQAPGASTARGNKYLAQITPVPVVVRARRTPQCPPLRYTSPAISQTAKRRNFGFIDPTNRGQSLPVFCSRLGESSNT